MKEHVMPGINTGRAMNEFITLDHGAGGRLTHELIEGLFARYFGMKGPLTDSEILVFSDGAVAFTTDSYVVDPVFFPGGNIGKLAVCGTVNDLAVSGAVPEYLSASFIIEEGLSVADLKTIVVSMAEEAEKAGVRIVTGDTKVVEKGKCDKLFINTSGTGTLSSDRMHIGKGISVKEGDRLIVNGSMGNHAIAVLGSRKNLSFTTPVESDCASLNHLIEKILTLSGSVHFMRDITRGGLAGVLNELWKMTGKGITIDEDAVPVDDPVRGACEMLGFDPLCLANEGKILIVSSAGASEQIVDILRSDPLGRNASVIGEVMDTEQQRVFLRTPGGGKRILDTPAGILLPRIC
jgi:hydrogenase expression/formation protein HypE